ncbi:c-type cytochrome [Imhoffiella purpurea]|uniref:Putative cytochrome c4 family protein n=1 Tax=Imhoffiella purpurea TaxID=1249627 RepID=W9VG09_9GAMM|nr:c-type cytochrome [Imhoffiella purpurea]EXJ15931.1 putative cytochrome c4 family protein [Imhoffiella purpurea]
MILRQAIAAIVLLFCTLATAFAADGAELYRTRLCDTCHGERPDAPVLPIYPKLAGQTATYLLQQMKDIRDGRRTNGLSVAMRTAVGPLPDAELEILAEWLANE